MRASVIGVVRSAHRLDTLTYEASDSPDHTQPWKRAQNCELRPLAHNARTDLWSAWRALERVSDWNPATLEHVLAVLRETVPSTDTPTDLPTLGSEVHAPPEPRATAAHPRAFRGTKYRPPKPRRPQPVDVRPYLLTRRHVDHVLEQLGQPRGIDPYVAWHYGVEAGASFDPAFVMYLLPLLRGCTWSEVGAFAALARTMELHVNPELRVALVGVSLAAEDPGRALRWWSHVLAHETEQRLEIAQLVSASGVAKVLPPDADFAAQIARLPFAQQWSIYRGILAGARPAYISSGLDLAALSSSKIEEVPPGRVDVTSIIGATIQRLDKAMEEDSGAEFWGTHLWRLCGYQPELAELLASPAFISLQPEAAFWMIRVASSPRWSPETADKQWRELAPILPLLVEFAAGVAPEYQRKFVEDMGDVYWWAVDNEHDITDALARCVDLCFRIAKPPFTTKSTVGTILPSMALVDLDWEHGPEQRAIRDAPDSSWVALEDACKRTNQVRLLGRGLNRLSQSSPRLLASTFTTNPGSLLETAESLASISFETAKQLIDAYAKSPLASPMATEGPIETLCAVIEPVVQAGGPNPIRRALREHLAGTRTLSEEQLRGHRERVVADIGIVRLAAIRQAVERALAARIGAVEIETTNMRHALAMLTNVEMHRRQLRRMLAATAAGDADWRLRHPRTKGWLARHPKLDVDVWTAGIDMPANIEGVGVVRFAIEKDPLEALKLGTYVGSCLGRGGNLEYSAAAVVLDINKQVVYARDPRGSVIGRQLIAVSESDELVCFSVYGSAKAELIEPLFREFDRALASKLGLPLLGRDSDEYVIATILSHEWWDDCAWLDSTL